MPNTLRSRRRGRAVSHARSKCWRGSDPLIISCRLLAQPWSELGSCAGQYAQATTASRSKGLSHCLHVSPGDERAELSRSYRTFQGRLSCSQLHRTACNPWQYLVEYDALLALTYLVRVDSAVAVGGGMECGKSRWIVINVAGFQKDEHRMKLSASPVSANGQTCRALRSPSRLFHSSCWSGDVCNTLSLMGRNSIGHCILKKESPPSLPPVRLVRRTLPSLRLSEL